MLLDLKLFDFLLRTAIDVFFRSASELLGSQASARRQTSIALYCLLLRSHLHLIHQVLVRLAGLFPYNCRNHETVIMFILLCMHDLLRESRL